MITPHLDFPSQDLPGRRRAEGEAVAPPVAYERRTGERGNGRPPRRKCRVALYSHDAMGIGHVRRNLLIAEALIATSRCTSALIIAGAREAAAFSLPAGVDCLTLPSVGKDQTGRQPGSETWQAWGGSAGSSPRPS